MSSITKSTRSLLLQPLSSVRPGFGPTAAAPSCSKFAAAVAAPFSTSTPCQKRCSNRKYRISALRGTGLGSQKLSVTLADLPAPVYDPALRTKPETSPTHGLWGFFNAKRTVLSTPQEDAEHGRGWHAEELRRKAWSDLHHLWWTCARERNRLRSEAHTRKRLSAGFGALEAQEREKAVVKTMRTIRAVLVERWYGWNDAYDLAQKDPEIEFFEDEAGQLRVNYTPLEDADSLEGLDPEVEAALLLEQETARAGREQEQKGGNTTIRS